MSKSKNSKLNANLAFSLVEISIVILIIGILIAGITNGMDLYYDYRVEMAKQITQKSRVATLKNLVAWFESSQKSSFEPNNIGNEAKITKWKNIAPTLIGKLHLEPVPLYGTVPKSLGPSFKENTQSSLPGAYFELNYNNCLYLPAGYDIGSLQNTIFILFKLDKLNDGQNRIISTWNSSRNYWFEGRVLGHIINSNTGVSYFTNPTISNNGSYSKNRTELLNYYIKPGNAKLYHNKNLISEKNDVLVYSAYSQAHLTFGCKFGIGYNYPSILIYEIIVFDRYINDQERKIVEDYLYKKWNL